MNDSDKADGAPVTVEELIALREGDLSEEQASALTARIDRDPRAQELLVELEQTDQALDRMRNQPVPPDLSQSIDKLIAREQARRVSETDQTRAGPDDDARAGGAGDGDDGPVAGGTGSSGSP